VAIGAGNNITATDFNALVVAVNKYWGDNVPSAAVTDPDRSTHKYGWGQTHALELSGTDDRVAATETVEAKHFNQLVARANATGLHIGLGTNLSYKIIGNNILAADGTTIENRFSASVLDAITDARSAAIRGDHTIGAGNSNANALGSINRTTNWTEVLISEQTITFTSYQKARHFFNSGGAITLGWDITGASGTESLNWDANLAAMGTVHFLADDVVVSGTGGYSTPDVGFYGLTTNFQLCYSYSFGDGVGSGTFSSSSFSGGDVNVGGHAYMRGGYLQPGGGGYAYAGTYAINRISIYAKYSSNGEVVHLKAYLQTPDDGSAINGTLTQSLGYVIASNQSGSGGTGGAAASTTFNVTSSAPQSHAFTNSLTSFDDH
jgi:hypothetical protein|tara:strand:- start:6753 stop:7886 length:1134 start_codon:yes stop_codon:yes gene_type:complete